MNVIDLTTGQPLPVADPDAADPTEDVRGPDGMTASERYIWWLGYNTGWDACQVEEDRLNEELQAKVQAIRDARSGRSAPPRLVVTA